MAKGYGLGDLRAAIEGINREVTSERENGEASNLDVLARLKKTRPQLVEAFMPQLADIALIKLLNEVCRRKAAGSSLGGRFDLFESYPKVPESVTITKGIKKRTSKLTVEEAQDWLRKHSKRTVKNDNEDFRRLVEECIKHARSENETIEDILNRRHASSMV